MAATIIWALLGLTAVCGTSWSYPVGVTTITNNQEIHISDSSSSSSEEEVINTVEAKLTVTTVVEETPVEDAKDPTSHEEAQPITEANEEKATLEGVVDNEGGESVVENVSPSSHPRSTEDVEEGEESNTDVSDS